MQLDISTLLNYLIYLYLNKFLSLFYVICYVCTAIFTVERLQLILPAKLLKPLKQNPG